MCNLGAQNRPVSKQAILKTKTGLSSLVLNKLQIVSLFACAENKISSDNSFETQ